MEGLKLGLVDTNMSILYGTVDYACMCVPSIALLWGRFVLMGTFYKFPLRERIF